MANRRWVGFILLFCKSYQSNNNQIVLDTLVKEVKALKPEFSTKDIRGKFLLEEVKILLYFVGAAYHFYRSTCESQHNQRDK